MVFLRSPILRQQLSSPQGFASKYGPVMKGRPHLGGFPLVNSVRYLPMTAGMGAAALIVLLFLGEDIPTVKRDIFQRIPIIGDYWVRPIPPEDNPF